MININQTSTLSKSDPYRFLSPTTKIHLVDIGAAGGFHPRFKDLENGIRPILFEPDVKAYKELKRNKNKEVFNCALDRFKGQRKFFLNKKRETSSYYAVNYAFIERFPEAYRFCLEKEIILNTNSLDEALISTIDDIDFIKIDTQGSELDILKGAFESLNHSWGVEIEVEFQELYKNQPLFTDVDIFLREQGFELFDIQRFYFCRKTYPNITKNRGQLIFGNALYFKSLDRIRTYLENMVDNDGRREKFFKLLLLLKVYQRNDYALELLDFVLKNKIISIPKDRFEVINLSMRQSEKIVLPEFPGKSKLLSLLRKTTSLFNHQHWYTADSDL